MREFTGVTAITRDEHRGLVFLADGSGIWILQQKLAMDPEVEKAYANYRPPRLPGSLARAYLLFAHDEPHAHGRYAEAFAETDRQFSAATAPHGRQ